MRTRPIHQFMFLSATLATFIFAGCSASRFGHKSSCSTSCAQTKVAKVQCEESPQNNCGCAQHANPATVPESKLDLEISPDVAPPSPVPAKSPAVTPPAAKPPVKKQPVKSALIDERFIKSPAKRKILREATNRPKFPTMNNNNSNFNKFDNIPYAEPRTSLPPVPELENDQNLSHGDMPGSLWKPLEGVSDENDLTYAPTKKVMKEQEVEIWPYQINKQPVLQSQKKVLGIRKISSEVHANQPIMIIPSIIN